MELCKRIILTQSVRLKMLNWKPPKTIPETLNCMEVMCFF